MWVVAAWVGLLVGRLRRTGRWLGPALWACLGYLLTPHLLTLILVGPQAYSAHGASTTIAAALWDIPAAPILILCAWLAGRRSANNRPAAPTETESATT